MKSVWIVMAALLGSFSVQQVQASPKVCIFDLRAEMGASYRLMQQWAAVAPQWGTAVQLQVYENEAQLEKDVKDGKCAAFYMSSMRARAYNKFAGSIDAFGAITRDDIAVRAIQTVLHPRHKKRLISTIGKDQFEVAGIYPIGLAYVFVKDRTIRNFNGLKDHKMAVLHYDYAQKVFTERVKAEAVMSEMSNFSRKFNQNEVDVIAAPAYAFQSLEIPKGLGAQGGMLDFPVVNITTMLMIRSEYFPENFADQSRVWFTQQLSKRAVQIKREKVNIPRQFLVAISKQEQLNTQKLLREIRIDLTKQGIYDARMMSLLKSARCTLDRTNFECTISGE